MLANYNEKAKLKTQKARNTEDMQREERLMRKLNKAKELYRISRAKRPRPLSPKFKVPRPLTTCPSALDSLLKKAKLVGSHTDYRVDQQQQRATGSLAFSVDFINYYFGMY